MASGKAQGKQSADPLALDKSTHTLIDNDLR